MKPEELPAHMARAIEQLTKPRDLLEKAALIVERNSKQAISSGPTRAVKTGSLRRDIGHRVELSRAYVGNALEYAPFVHGGTSKMPARPYLNVGLENSMADLQQMMDKFGGEVLSRVQ